MIQSCASASDTLDSSDLPRRLYNGPSQFAPMLIPPAWASHTCDLLFAAGSKLRIRDFCQTFKAEDQELREVLILHGFPCAGEAIALNSR